MKESQDMTAQLISSVAVREVERIQGLLVTLSKEVQLAQRVHSIWYKFCENFESNCSTISPVIQRVSKQISEKGDTIASLVLSDLQCLSRTLESGCDIAKDCSTQSRVIIFFSGIEVCENFERLSEDAMRFVENLKRIAVKEQNGSTLIIRKSCELRNSDEKILKRFFHLISAWPLTQCFDTNEANLIKHELEQRLQRPCIEAAKSIAKYIEIPGCGLDTKKLLIYSQVARILASIGECGVRQSEEYSSGDEEIPTGKRFPRILTCPLTRTLMCMPYKDSFGYTYERDAVLKEFAKEPGVCPITKKAYPNSDPKLLFDKEISDKIQEYLENRTLKKSAVLCDNCRGNVTDKHQNWSALHHAVARGHLACISSLIKAGADVNALEEDGATPLLIGAQLGNVEVVRALLEHPRTDVNLPLKGGICPLFVVAREGRLEALQLLLKHPKLDINAPLQDGTTSLHAACEHGHDLVVRLLLSHEQANVNATRNDGASALHLSAAMGHAGVVQTLLSHRQVAVNQDFEGGAPPLYLAALQGHTQVIRMLLRHPHIHVNATAQHTEATPLHAAAQSGHTEVVSLLLESPLINTGARVKGVDDTLVPDGSTALHIAVAYHRRDIIKALLTHNSVDMNVTTQSGYTPLHMAAEKGFSQIVKTLLFSTELSVNARLPGPQAETPILLALRAGHTKVVHRLMCDPRIDLNTTMQETGCSLLQLACEQGEVNTVKALLARDPVDSGAVNAEGSTALHMAVRSGRVNIVTELVAHASKGLLDLNVQDKNDGSTGLHLAVWLGNVEVVRQLLQGQGLDINLPRNDGLTALDLAILQEMACRAEKGGTHSLSSRPSSMKGGLRWDTASMHSIGSGERKVKSQKGQTSSSYRNRTQSALDTVVPRRMGSYELSARTTQRRHSLHMGRLSTSSDQISEMVAQSRQTSVDQMKGIDFRRSSGSFEALRGRSKRRGWKDEEGGEEETADLEEDEATAQIREHFQAMRNPGVYNSVTSSMGGKHGQESVVKLMLLHPALKINAHSPHKRAMLHVAVREGAHAVVQQLLPHCSMLDFKYSIAKGTTLLHTAARRGHVEVVRLLLSFTDIDVNCLAGDGSTPLHLAVREGHIEVVQLLLASPNIDIAIPYQDGWKPLSIAKKFNHYEVIEILHKHKRKRSLHRSWSSSLGSTLGDSLKSLGHTASNVSAKVGTSFFRWPHMSKNKYVLDDVV